MSEALLEQPVQEIIEPVVTEPTPVLEIVKTIPLPVVAIEPELPEWLTKIRQRQVAYNERYEKAHDALFDVYQEFLSQIDEVNNQFKTNFDLADVVRDFESKELVASKI